MTQGQLVLKLQELKSYLWLETGNANMLYGKREYIQDKINEIIEDLDDTNLEDTPDIMDAGINDYGTFDFIED